MLQTKNISIDKIESPRYNRNIADSGIKHHQANKQYIFASRTLEHLDWITQTATTFTSQLNLRCKLISCTFQLTLKFIQGLCNQVQYRDLLPATKFAPVNVILLSIHYPLQKQ
jgi:hypothetical protein